MNIDHINFEIPNLKLPIVIIIGPPGAGKTAVGKQLAHDLNWNFYDTDALIEKATALKIAEIFSRHSENAFRQLESKLVQSITRLLESNNNNSPLTRGTIISCGGGLPVAPDNFSNLTKWGRILCLHAPIPVLVERVSRVKNRPLLNPTAIASGSVGPNANPDLDPFLPLSALISQREAVYAQAEYKIDTANKSIEEVITETRELLKL